ncbi:uncharacterized protein EDB91DRAFT_1085798 [Suillus paluster]|uniref:uncharacterized protein n=1 Tax=Suillus paluster TaxID=48578 RepID=UPI001B87D1D1|nr:uncharacterized protein EDB91DRAFT_1085798 [Suillus paluster]KAG1729184.1 hypothetical protein EDB91DRAFT_1085798 [Suillus paluster]
MASQLQTYPLCLAHCHAANPPSTASQPQCLTFIVHPVGNEPITLNINFKTEYGHVESRAVHSTLSTTIMPSSQDDSETEPESEPDVAETHKSTGVSPILQQQANELSIWHSTTCLQHKTDEPSSPVKRLWTEDYGLTCGTSWRQ